MRTVNLAEAKAHLSKLVERAAAGDVVCITRRGKPMAKLSAAMPPRARVDASALRRLTETMPKQRIGAGKFMRRLRDESRY